MSTGIGRTAAVISAAGAIMTLVFTGFVLENQSEIKMIGLGLAVAVLIDVTLVRLLLTAAVLRLLGTHGGPYGRCAGLPVWTWGIDPAHGVPRSAMPAHTTYARLPAPQ